MIVIDTNIISELMRSIPSDKVMSWINLQPSESLYVTSVTLAEISYGLHILPYSKRRTLLENRFEQFISQAFYERVLDFTEKEARIYGELMGYHKEAGKPLSVLDGQIAAISLAHNMALATRNTKDFIECGIELINPFSEDANS